MGCQHQALSLEASKHVAFMKNLWWNGKVTWPLQCFILVFLYVLSFHLQLLQPSKSHLSNSWWAVVWPRPFCDLLLRPGCGLLFLSLFLVMDEMIKIILQNDVQWLRATRQPSRATLMMCVCDAHMLDLSSGFQQFLFCFILGSHLVVLRKPLLVLHSEAIFSSVPETRFRLEVDLVLTACKAPSSWTISLVQVLNLIAMCSST